MLAKRYVRGLYALALGAIWMIGSAGATSANTDLSDLWWNPAESGWGMQMVNTGTFVFATVYVYGTDRKPTWMTGQLTKTGAAQTTYSGPLYVTNGPWFGGPATPPAVAREAGTMTFVLTTVSAGQLSYSVDGISVSKAVQRQPLTLYNYAGSYIVAATQTVTGCLNPADNGTFTDALAFDIAQNGQAMTMVSKNSSGGSCSYSGTYSQLGRMGQATGTYACTWGEVGTVTFFEMSNVPYMFTARMQSSSSNFGCGVAAEFAGVIPRD